MAAMEGTLPEREIEDHVAGAALLLAHVLTLPGRISNTGIACVGLVVYTKQGIGAAPALSKSERIYLPIRGQM